ncbi:MULTISPECIES: sugar transferase [Lactiplantibacillus]|jgi:lipopolysaccharide/colanic/teichoic acid biosynthesis glycosyltransferase|uniref:sugar transferase n=1 Tax=Lactiplantibacillus TaxID=2767842 RepID=UPI00019F5222|nr:MULTISPECIES: sugar transferase [Lactiplantibacillus]MCM8651237.1 sugar transferase [Lactiplantibacillus sp. E932]PNW63735.1 multidrug MFS transporter [Lactobacillus sp. ATCC 15578]AXH03901.1 sugar transferase [Lactiplantibacillus plantarum]AXQ27038.1 sugar transferase [Lactiplantibacillus plantarum]EFK29251.1 bacterial sugar transferase [Lactiplantibacillus plantarum subsp. plantarum ATCC 14917 = JCM 1149 = CGMCC 1.2437]
MEYSGDNSKTIIIDPIVQRERYGYRLIKRLFDVCASFTALVLLSPMFLVVAIAIKAEDSQGKVFYSQIRVGKGGKRFKMYKFRSMVSNADELLKTLISENDVDGAMFKMKLDPRVTKVGSFIRKYSIDELPQLVNVLKGNMSLVGPRPPLEREVKEYTDYDKQRLYVKPGCTGLWQATVRNSVGFDEMVRLDLIYVQKRSLKFDLWIIFRTVKIMFRPNGAY